MIIPISIDPVAVAVAGIEIRWYGIFAALSVAVALLLARAGARRAGLRVTFVDDAAVWVGIAAIAGGRLLYLVQSDLDDLAAHPLHALAIWHGGLSFYGGLVAGLVALMLWARQRRISLGLAADIAAPGVAAGQAVGHIGCLVGGDSYGLASTGPLAVLYSNPGAMAPLGIPLHPTQLYEAVALGALALALWSARRRLAGIGPGALAAVFLIGNAAIRFVLFFLRDDVVVVGGLKVAQLIAVTIAVVAVAWLLVVVSRRRATRRPGASTARVAV